MIHGVVFRHAHGVGPVTFSNGLAEPFFNLAQTPVAPAGGTVAVSGEVRLQKGLAVFGMRVPDNGAVFYPAFHRLAVSSF